MPDDLLDKYWLKETGRGVGDNKGVGVAEMLESLFCGRFFAPGVTVFGCVGQGPCHSEE